MGSLKESANSLTAALEKSEADLESVAHKLGEGFYRTYGNQANPMQLMKRIRRIQDALPELRRGAEQVLAAKQEVVAALQDTVLSNAEQLASLQRAAGRTAAAEAAAEAATATATALGQWQTRYNTLTM